MTQILPDLRFKDLEDIQLWPYYWKVFNSQFPQYLIFDDYTPSCPVQNKSCVYQSQIYLSIDEVSSEVINKQLELENSTIQLYTSFESYESKRVSLTFVLRVS